MEEWKTEVLLFGGTSEGRELAEYAACRNVPVTVSVVSEYGEGLLSESPYIRVHMGALDQDEMRAFLERENPALVLDATHPYARVVTQQLSSLCEERKLPYKRVLRAQQNTGSEGVIQVASAAEAAAVLAEDTSPVLLTTGSKELGVFAAKERLRGRIYARVLPDSRVVASCEQLGISGAHLIAMQGPFSEEMNKALLHATGAKWLVTKESGSRGGFKEKLRAAASCGVKVIVIERPDAEQGITMEEAKELLGTFGVDSGTGEVNRCEERRRSLVLLGMGMGGARQLTLEAVEELRRCDVVFGASRMLEDVASFAERAEKVPLYGAGDIADWLDVHPKYKRGAVVYSGDTGFYSGSRMLLEKLRGQRVKVMVCPGISSLSALCARFQISWEDVYPASVHGRDCDICRLLKEHRRVFLLLGGKESLASICKRLCGGGLGQVCVRAGVRMGYDDEQLLQGRAEELIEKETDGLAAVLLERREE